jgi:CBS domain-containing protein
MKIKELARGVVVISADSTIQIAAQAMKESDIDSLPVHQEGVLEGILTGRDIVTRVIAENRDPSDTLVSDVMTDSLLTCPEDMDVEDVVRLLKEKQVHRIVVLDQDENPTGLVTLADIAMNEKVKVAAEKLHEVQGHRHLV